MTPVNRPAANPINTDVVAHTRPPAKLNLFLELLARRDDGFHEIDTVMVPIDWCDQLSLRRTTDPGIDLSVSWIPSRQAIAMEFGVDPNSDAADRLLTIPSDESNLVHRALTRFSVEYETDGGFQCTLEKSIPAGAGMGGASSDAASALRCAAILCGIDPSDEQLIRIAADIGSDVPFFMGVSDQPQKSLSGEEPQPMTAARAKGRGEKIKSVALAKPIDFVVAFPPVALSTSLVYASSRVPQQPKSADALIAALENGANDSLESTLLNRLDLPAKKLAPQIGETLQSMWRLGLRTCQLTGSGSACFAITRSLNEAMTIAQQLGTETIDLPDNEQGSHRLKIRSKAARSVSVPAKVVLTQTG